MILGPPRLPDHEPRLAVTVSSLSSSHADTHASDYATRRRKTLRVPAFPGRYGEEAVSNLSNFRTNLMAVNAHLFIQQPASDFDRKYARFDMYQPLVSCPPGRIVQRVGPRRGEDKLLCAMSNLTAPCIIYSLGSRMEFEFEEAMLRSTPCEVHTFDCTVAGRQLDPQRHFFHQVCIGAVLSAPAPG